MRGGDGFSTNSKTNNDSESYFNRKHHLLAFLLKLCFFPHKKLVNLIRDAVFYICQNIVVFSLQTKTLGPANPPGFLGSRARPAGTRTQTYTFAAIRPKALGWIWATTRLISKSG